MVFSFLLTENDSDAAASYIPALPASACLHTEPGALASYPLASAVRIVYHRSSKKPKPPRGGGGLQAAKNRPSQQT